MDIVNLTLGKAKFKVEIEDRTFAIYRNGKCQSTTTFPVKQKHKLQADILAKLTISAIYEIQHELSNPTD